MFHPLIDLPNFDPSFRVEYYHQYGDYESYHYLCILSKDQAFYVQEGGHAAMSDQNAPDVFAPQRVSEEDALAQILEFEEWAGPGADGPDDIFPNEGSL